MKFRDQFGAVTVIGLKDDGSPKCDGNTAEEKKIRRTRYFGGRIDRICRWIRHEAEEQGRTMDDA